MAFKWLVLCFLFVALGSCEYDATQVKVDLDISPRERWRDITQSVLEKHGWEHSFQPLVNYFHEKIPKELLDAAEPILQGLLKNFPAEFQEEIRGIYDAMADSGFG